MPYLCTCGAWHFDVSYRATRVVVSCPHIVHHDTTDMQDISTSVCSELSIPRRVRLVALTLYGAVRYREVEGQQLDG